MKLRNITLYAFMILCLIQGPARASLFNIPKDWFPVGINVGRSSDDGGHAGIELSYVTTGQDHVFYGFYGDFLFTGEGYRASFGPEIGTIINKSDLFMGVVLDGGPLIVSNDRGTHLGGAVRLTFPVYTVMPYLRGGGYKGTGFAELGVLLKFPFPAR